MSETLYRKYRPMTFKEVTGQEHVTTTLQNQLVAGTVAHAYLLTGPRGVGKTTIARLLAKAVNCEHAKKKGEPCNKCPSCEEVASGAALDVIEVDAASHTKVEETRENIIASVRFAPSRLSRKVFIIDEVHMLSTASFNALLKTLEEPPAHALFILATTEVHKVPATVLSRCQRFDFHRIPAPVMIDRLRQICKSEDVEVEMPVLEEIARRSDGCARDAESLLEQVLSLGEKHIDVETASLVLPISSGLAVADFLDLLGAKDANGCVQKVKTLVEGGVDLPFFLDDIVSMLQAIMLHRLGDQEALSALYGGETLERVKQVSTAFSAPTAAAAVETFLSARRSMKQDRIPELSLELAVLKICEQLNFQKPGVDSGWGKGVKGVNGVQGVEEKTKDSVMFEKSFTPPTPHTPPTPILEAKTVVFDSVPVVSLDEVRNKWPDVFSLLKETNATLPVMLQAGEVTKVRGDEVELSVRYQMYADTINTEKNQQALLEAMTQVIGRPLRIVARHQASADEIANVLISEFGGSAS